MCQRKARYNENKTFSISYTKQEKSIYPTNFIRTSKYNVVTFFPISLLLQFKRYANIYFLATAIIQSFPQVSPLTPFSAIAPLVIVLGLSMIREGVEDWGRHKSDAEVNAMDCTRMENNQQTLTSWADLHVGDLLLIKQDEMFPADLIVIGSSYETGVCYIETSSLDGEKNLKPKSSIKESQQLFSNLQFKQEQLNFFAVPPNPQLSEFNGNIHFADGSQKSLNGKQLLLRGAFLRNTDWILGVIAYTGEDTKIMRNAEDGSIKQSSIEGQMNKLILCILAVQSLACVTSAVLNSWWMHKQGNHHSYFWQSSWDPNQLAFLSYFSYFLLYNTMIPISLVVSLEFVKVFQCYFIEKDEDMYEPKRQKYAKAQTSTINEELGQVEYVFSDKTGTLTCNQMEFKYCIIGDVLYGKDNESPKSPKAKEQDEKDIKVHQHSIFTFQDKILSGIIEGDQQFQQQSNQQRNFVIISQDQKQQFTLQNQQQLINEYLFLLCSAHECLAQHVNDKTVYQGPSPDEITLVDAAMNLGYKFEGQSSSSQNFTILGKKKQIELFYQFEFDSARKRMSVIVKDGGIYKLYIKGADNIIKDRLSHNQPYLGFIQTKLNEFSQIGLRTLLMAMKVLSEQEFQEFDLAMQKISQAKDREAEKEKLADLIERDLYLLGATAVEDKLQDQVPETIADLLKANIKVWMLTGDKLETAENIARSCRLIQGDFTVMRFADVELNALRQRMFDNKDTYSLCIKEKRKKSFVVEGASLQLIIDNAQLQREFVKMAASCDSVVCCRVTPKQKAAVVALIKKNLNKITLAIGDGANDVNMIQEAHIGIGLYGNEGMRAVQSSDFALGEFKCLWKLLLVHGHWSYIRISEMILYFFYKNMIFTVPQFLFAFYSAYSAQTFFDDWYITFYNLFFTSLPLIIRATIDRDAYYKIKCQDLSQKDILDKGEKYLRSKFPELYYIGQKQTIFTIPNFIFWWGQGFVHGCLVYFLTLSCYQDEMIQSNGQMAGFAAFSITAYTAIIFIVDIKISIYTKFWTWINVFVLMFCSIGIYVAYFFISNYFPGTYSQYTPIQLLKSPIFYLVIIFLNAAIFIFDLTINAILHEYYGTESDRIVLWRRNFKQIAKKQDAVKFIELIQLQKRESGERQWGDSFYEGILDERMQSEREQKIAEEDVEQRQYAISSPKIPVRDKIDEYPKFQFQQVPKPLEKYVR